MTLLSKIRNGLGITLQRLKDLLRILRVQVGIYQDDVALVVNTIGDAIPNLAKNLAACGMTWVTASSVIVPVCVVGLGVGLWIGRQRSRENPPMFLKCVNIAADVAPVVVLVAGAVLICPALTVAGTIVVGFANSCLAGQRIGTTWFGSKTQPHLAHDLPRGSVRVSELLERQVAAEHTHQLNTYGPLTRYSQIESVSADRQDELNMNVNIHSNETLVELLEQAVPDVMPLPGSVSISEENDDAQSPSQERALEAPEALDREWQELKEQEELLPQVSQPTVAEPRPDTEDKVIFCGLYNDHKNVEQNWRQIQQMWLDLIDLGLDIVNVQCGNGIIPWIQTLDKALPVDHHTAHEGEIVTHCFPSSSGSSSNRQCQILLLRVIPNTPTWNLLKNRQRLKNMLTLAGLEPVAHSSRCLFHHDWIVTCDASYFDALTDPAQGHFNVSKTLQLDSNSLNHSTCKTQRSPLELKLGLRPPTESLDDPDVPFRLRILKRQTLSRTSEEALRNVIAWIIIQSSELVKNVTTGSCLPIMHHAAKHYWLLMFRCIRNTPMWIQESLSIFAVLDVKNYFTFDHCLYPLTLSVGVFPSNLYFIYRHDRCQLMNDTALNPPDLFILISLLRRAVERHSEDRFVQPIAPEHHIQ